MYRNRLYDIDSLYMGQGSNGSAEIFLVYVACS